MRLMLNCVRKELLWKIYWVDSNLAQHSELSAVAKKWHSHPNLEHRHPGLEPGSIFALSLTTSTKSKNGSRIMLRISGMTVPQV
jgi:hypothetical protein